MKNATLIGTNVQILKEVEMIGNDTAFFLGTLRQGRPVGAGHGRHAHLQDPSDDGGRPVMSAKTGDRLGLAQSLVAYGRKQGRVARSR